MAAKGSVDYKKKFYTYTYSKAMGISMITFAIALSIGVSITTAVSTFAATSTLSPIQIWSVLIAATVIIIISSFSYAHVSSIRYLEEQLHNELSKYKAAWITTIIIGVIVCVMSILYINSPIEPLVLLFSFGGVFWIIYISIDMLFAERYSEVAAGALALWAVFFIGLFESRVNYLLSNGSLALLVSSVTLIAIFGVTGMTLLVNSSNRFNEEISKYLDIGDIKRGPRRRKKR